MDPNNVEDLLDNPNLMNDVYIDNVDFLIDIVLVVIIRQSETDKVLKAIMI
jgi:hypothetical protein